MFLRKQFWKLRKFFANEATVSCLLNMQGGNLGAYTFLSTPPAFTANVSAAGAQGPVPGSIQVVSTGTGTAISLAALTNPGGLAQIKNNDAAITITIGLLVSATFQPLFDLLPGESYIVRFAAAISTFQAKAASGSPYLEVLAHNK